MKSTITTIIVSPFLFLIALFPFTIHGETATGFDLTAYRTIRFNNENWHTLPHPKVLDFSVHEDGSVQGLTENGLIFVQYNVPNEYGIRVQRFEIEDHYHYIVEGEIANSFTELSVLLAKAYTLKQTG